MEADVAVRSEDVIPVRSRVSWSAIVAGSVLALSLYFMLALLGGATGLSISDKVSPSNLGTGAAIYAIIVTVVCLFLGGYVASQLTTGENKIEGSLYGLFVWATVFAALLWLMAAGVKVGFNAMIGVATAGAVATDGTRQGDWEAAARDYGKVPQEKIEEWKAKAKETGTSAKAAVEDPNNQKAAADAATRVTWFTFFGVWLSMMAAAAGGYIGSGPTIKMLSVSVDRVRSDARTVGAAS